ncbi:MAG: DUF5672 family protein [Chitinophagaceae bacterium]
MEDEKNIKVVVLIMVYQERLSDWEKISLIQGINLLKDYPIRIVKPLSLKKLELPVDQELISTESFPDKYFEHIGTYSRLLLSLEFYKRFKQFEYVLIYQLDAFVFKNELADWCLKDYHYIGAPWFEDYSSDNNDAALIGLGNGGFSLRNVSAHLRVLQSFSYLSPPKENWKRRMKDSPKGFKLVRQVGGFLLDLTVRNNTFWLLNSFMGFEDQFWSLVAPKNFKWFKIADVREAMNFSIEMQPRRVYTMNNNQLPFGCHAWWKYDLEFWKPHIERFGYRLPNNEPGS